MPQRPPSVPLHGPNRAPADLVAPARPGALPLLGLAVVGCVLLAACGDNSERSLPDARPPAVDTLSPNQIVTEAQRALAGARSVHVIGAYRENNVPVKIDMRIAAGNRATGTVTTNGTSVTVRRIGDQLYVKGDDAFLAALGDKAKATKGKWLVGPVAQADRGLANLTDLQSFAGTLTPGSGTLRKELVRSFAGQPAVSVLNPNGARLWVADSDPPHPLRLERIGAAIGSIDYRDFDATVDVKAPSPTVPLSSVSS